MVKSTDTPTEMARQPGEQPYTRTRPSAIASLPERAAFSHGREWPLEEIFKRMSLGRSAAARLCSLSAGSSSVEDVRATWR